MVVWQPKGFNPCDCLPQHLYRYADYARFYVGMIVQFTLRLKNVNRKDKQWAHLSHRKASRFFPDTDTYKAVRDALIAARVVECDWDFEIGWHSMGYRLGERSFGTTSFQSYNFNDTDLSILSTICPTAPSRSCPGLLETHSRRVLGRIVRERR